MSLNKTMQDMRTWKCLENEGSRSPRRIRRTGRQIDRAVQSGMNGPMPSSRKTSSLEYVVRTKYIQQVNKVVQVVVGQDENTDTLQVRKIIILGVAIECNEQM